MSHKNKTFSTFLSLYISVSVRLHVYLSFFFSFGFSSSHVRTADVIMAFQSAKASLLLVCSVVQF